MSSAQVVFIIYEIEMGSGKQNDTFSNLLQRIDLFGQAPYLKYNELNACNSRFGGVISVCVILAWALSLIFTVWRYFERSSPETNYNNVYVNDPVGFELNSTSFPFAFGMQDSSASHFIDGQIYAVQASYRLYTKKTVDGVVIVDRQKIMIERAKCNTMILDKQYFHNVDLNNMYCIKNITLPMMITGNFESDTWGWIYIGFNSMHWSKL